MDIKGKRLRLLFSDVLGVERGKYLFGDVADAGHSAFCVGVFPLTTDKEILDISRQQFDVGLPDVEAFIDRDTLRPGWEEDTIVGIADVQQHGKALEVDPREVLRRAVEPWRAMGLEPMFAFESEFYLLERGPEGGWQPVELPSHRVYGTGTSVDPTGTIDAMVRAAQQCGFPIEGWASEFDTAAYEVNIRYKEVIPAADECFLFRLLVKETATKQGKLATFMGRPFNDRGGSGLHLNISFRREDGSNALHDPNARDGLAPLTRQCIAGLLAHHEGIAAIAAPHANAYKRLQPDMLNGYWANWGFDDRTVCIRIPPGARGGHAHRASDGRRRREPVPGGRGGTPRGAVRGGASDVGARASDPRRAPEHRAARAAHARGGARGVRGRRRALFGARALARRDVHQAQAGGVGALRQDGRRRDDDRGHAVGARLLPAVLLSAPAGLVPAGRSVPNYLPSHPRRPR